MNMPVGERAASLDKIPLSAEAFVGRPMMGHIAMPPHGLVGEDFDRLVRILVAAFRNHGHVGNVFTHISGARWDRIGEALSEILNPNADHRKLNPLARNILDLLCANRGVTGRLAKPFFEEMVFRLLPGELAMAQCRHVNDLFDEISVADAVKKRWRNKTMKRSASLRN